MAFQRYRLWWWTMVRNAESQGRGGVEVCEWECLCEVTNRLNTSYACFRKELLPGNVTRLEIQSVETFFIELLGQRERQEDERNIFDSLNLCRQHSHGPLLSPPLRTLLYHTCGKLYPYKVHQSNILLLLSDQVNSSTPTVMTDTALTPMKVAKTDADPTGDLVLVIGSGDNQRSIRASSKALSLASPVLAAMFRPHHFSEGTALSSSNPPEIYLPDDDPEAFTMFCHLTHFREHHRKRPDPSITQLVNMALLCDKYDAGLAFSPWCELWLHSLLESSKDYGTLLGLAYAFDSQEGFWITSRDIMQYERAGYPYIIREELLALLPQGVSGK